MTSKKKPRLTIGCRARMLNTSHRSYAGHEVLLKERNSNGDFAVMILGKNVKELEKEKSGIVENEIAWVSESALELVDKDFDTNLDFMDWYEQHENDFCPDCLAWFPGNSGFMGKDPKTGKYLKCPNKKCRSNNLEDYEDLD
jgi:hypothetical protein